MTTTTTIPLPLPLLRLRVTAMVNNRRDNYIYGAVIMKLLCRESSPGFLTNVEQLPQTLRPSHHTWVIRALGCYRLQPPSPPIVIIQLNNCCSFGVVYSMSNNDVLLKSGSLTSFKIAPFDRSYTLVIKILAVCPSRIPKSILRRERGYTPASVHFTSTSASNSFEDKRKNQSACKCMVEHALR